MANKKARISLVGCGRIAKEGHLPYLRENKLVELVGAMDVNEKNRADICAKFDIGGSYEDAEKMLDETRPDGVLLCTPNWIHKDLTLMAAERGIHVFCEKPMAVNSEQCEQMTTACEKAGVLLQMGMAKRFDQGIVKVKKMFSGGELGHVSQIMTSCLNPPSPRFDSVLFETAKKWASLFGADLEEKLGLWRMLDPRTGGGLMLEMGTHLLDLIYFICGETPSEWNGFINKSRDDMIWENQGSMLVKFPSGLIASADMNMNTTANNLIGENGFVLGEKSSVSFSLINGMWFGLPFYHNIPTILLKYGTLSPLTGIGIPIPVKTGKSVYMYKRQMDYFVDRILGRDTDYFGFGADFAALGRDGLAAMRVIDTVYAGRNKEMEKEEPAGAAKRAVKAKAVKKRVAVKKKLK